MAKDLNLLAYLPAFLQEYREFHEIFSAEEPALNKANVFIDQLLQNQFITSCDEIGIGFFENLAGILPTASDDLHTRIERVLLKWNDYPPYTFFYLVNLLDNLYGEGNFQFIENFNDYSFHIKFFNNISPCDLIDFYKFIGDVKPANLIFCLSCHSTHTCGCYCGVAFAGKYNKSCFYFDDV